MEKSTWPYRKFDRTEEASAAAEKEEDLLGLGASGPWASVLALPGHELSAAWVRTADRLRHETVNEEKGSCLGGSPFVAVVKSTDLGYGHDWPHFHRLNRSRLGRIFG